MVRKQGTDIGWEDLSCRGLKSIKPSFLMQLAPFYPNFLTFGTGDQTDQGKHRQPLEEKQMEFRTTEVFWSCILKLRNVKWLQLVNYV